MESEDVSRDQELEIVKRHTSQLFEHFDCVQIFVSKCSNDLTVSYHDGKGNYHARNNQAREWTLRNEAQIESTFEDRDE